LELDSITYTSPSILSIPTFFISTSSVYHWTMSSRRSWSTKWKLWFSWPLSPSLSRWGVPLYKGIVGLQCSAMAGIDMLQGLLLETLPSPPASHKQAVDSSGSQRGHGGLRHWSEHAHPRPAATVSLTVGKSDSTEMARVYWSTISTSPRWKSHVWLSLRVISNPRGPRSRDNPSYASPLFDAPSHTSPFSHSTRHLHCAWVSHAWLS
jgi:hypothetical protein